MDHQLDGRGCQFKISWLFRPSVRKGQGKKLFSPDLSHFSVLGGNFLTVTTNLFCIMYDNDFVYCEARSVFIR